MISKLFRYGYIAIFFFAMLTTAVSSDTQSTSFAYQFSPLKYEFNKINAITASSSKNTATVPVITLFMAGDVMLGRGIDQVLAHPSKPVIYEPYHRSAIAYVKIAERKNGPIPYPVDCDYIWGDALVELKRVAPDVSIINLETSITKSKDYWPRKRIHYRLNPENIDCLNTANIDYVSLANNHVLDWGYSGLSETIATLNQANIKNAGAGVDVQQAEAAAVLKIAGKGRVLVFSYGDTSSGIPLAWAATDNKAGVNLLKDFSDKTVQSIKTKINAIKQTGDITVVSVHWGGNWGYKIDPAHIKFAYQLIDKAGVDIIHGHSSHHIQGIEVYNGKLIIYGSGDLLNDYEGINGKESFRSDLSLMYFATVDPSTGKLLSMQMTPTQIKNFKINYASKADTLWLAAILNREEQQFGSRVKLNNDGKLTLYWNR